MCAHTHVCVFVSRCMCLCVETTSGVSPPLPLFFFCDMVSHRPRTGKVSETGCPGSLRPDEAVWPPASVLGAQVCTIKPTAFYFILYFLYMDVLPAFLSVYRMRDWCPQRPEEDMEFPGMDVTNRWYELPCGCWDSNSGPLETLNHWDISPVAFSFKGRGSRYWPHAYKASNLLTELFLQPLISIVKG